MILGGEGRRGGNGGQQSVGVFHDEPWTDGMERRVRGPSHPGEGSGEGGMGWRVPEPGREEPDCDRGVAMKEPSSSQEGEDRHR